MGPHKVEAVPRRAPNCAHSLGEKEVVAEHCTSGERSPAVRRGHVQRGHGAGRMRTRSRSVVHVVQVESQGHHQQHGPVALRKEAFPVDEAIGGNVHRAPKILLRQKLAVARV